MAIATRVFYSDSRLRISFWQNVTIIDVGGDVDVARMRTVERGYKELLSEYPRGIVSLTMLRPGTPVASKAARAESVRYVKELGDSLLRVAMLIEAQGITAQMLRTVIRGINVLTRNTKLTVVSSLDEAVRSLGKFVVPPPNAQSSVESELWAAVMSARAAFHPLATATA